MKNNKEPNTNIRNEDSAKLANIFDIDNAISRLEIRNRWHFYGKWSLESIEETVKGEAAICVAEIATRSQAVAVYRCFDTFKGGYITFVMEFLADGDALIKVFVDDGDGMTAHNSPAPEIRKAMSNLPVLVDMPT
jgi:hypothetical protein